ncbi:uncharacterized protein K452DRAFT_291011 [Aplosporella prunicola CBS 121167]|uniref:Rad4 beta-hairpin domain-containing protein n=1 Tax=Aplosporella prunicola CBS 121167 TaxID=1176127 RepID=A0A6A6B4T8_9PEZI|nr:uncharacterized protein K452DRAFT_291011 [Aplosporella prunicola CBS 121167]KAF2137977.1 hypothetical protein K452DRAFT_291011 [Aplosporella prunicola CBS 121167]
MPPVVPRKRTRSTSPAPAASKRRGKRTVFDALDATSSTTVDAQDKAFLDALGGEDSDSDLSDAESDEFEDALPNKAKGKSGQLADQDEDEDEDEMDWEDALPAQTDTTTTPYDDSPHRKHAPWRRQEPDASDVLEVTLGEPSNDDDTLAQAALGPKGASKKDRQMRIATHCVHVQLLLFHNLTRNGWICNKEVHKILVEQLTDGVKKEVQRWRRDSGLPPDESLETEDDRKAKRKAARAKAKGKNPAPRRADSNQRDWGGTAERTENRVPNLSAGDPLLKLLKYLAAYWKKRFRITAPGLRKRGYMPSIKALTTEVKAFENTSNSASKNKGDGKLTGEDIERFGEQIRNVEEFKDAARKCEGSRDVGAQLFTALLRGLGLESRMVASLQPTGFGWGKVEEATAKKSQTDQAKANDADSGGFVKSPGTTKPSSTKQQPQAKPEKPIRASNKRTSNRTSGSKATPIDLDDDSDSELSSAPEDLSDASVVDITPSTQTPRLPNKSYDADLPFPTYWSEVLSPITQTWVAVSPLVISTVASTPELLSSFEPRGAAAEKAKQVICYVVAYSADGTAKDVTVRYLRKRIWPGKTKSFRLPVEKVPIYNSRGKVKRYEEFDWFKSVIRCYARDGRKRTQADEIEDEGDLVPVKPSASKKKDDAEPETLQGYKSSAKYVLERHLRREEAILPEGKPVKTFTTGKGAKATAEPVYRREDVVPCKTAESWHKEGRQIVPNTQPLKRVPMRAVTLIRKREIEEAERETGEKALQGLYAEFQTEWIIPPPIQDGKIPKNAYGNIDVYVPSMVPEGAVHVPLRGTGKLCRKLGIDYAEACTGFEFGNRRAVPILTGVVVASENGDLVREAWREEKRAQREKEDKKRQTLALTTWKRFLTGLRIMERVKADYRAEGMEKMPESENPFAKKKRANEVGNTFVKKTDDIDEEEEMGGGFLPDEYEDGADIGGGGFFPPGYDEEEATQGGGFSHSGPDEEDVGEGSFLRDGHESADEGGGFIIDHGSQDAKPASNLQHLSTTGNGGDAPFSLSSLHQSAPEPASKDGSLVDDAGQNGEEEQEHESDEQQESATTPSLRGRRGRGRGRATQAKKPATSRKAASAKVTRKQKKPSSDTEDSALSEEGEDEDEDEQSSLPSDAPSASEAEQSDSHPTSDHGGEGAEESQKSESETQEPAKTPRGRPKRQAASRSAKAVRSHYFSNDSADETDGVEATPAKKGAERGRGRGRGRPRGRGRGRGRGKI